MEELLEKLGAFILIISVIFLMSIVGGTILWMIYPHIHSLFPTAAENNIIASELRWWDAICISWIFNILFKNHTYKKDKE